ncbi:MAG: hypothetical protein JO152_02965 [Mycobacteriaceae bacterium]|nr:hypothetical protein [Mycobacteriaceae bacterium]MBV9369598.1 hypothetical protein [Frankiales bacterium]
MTEPKGGGRRRTPQEKKAFSYERDRRNSYGENDKASRKAIPLRKRLVNKSNRHADQQILSGASGPLDMEAAESAETRAIGRRPKVWRKRPDRNLGEHLTFQRKWRRGDS